MPDQQQTRATETICVPVAEANCPDSLQPASAVAEWAARFLTIPGTQKKRDSKTTDKLQRICFITKNGGIGRYGIITLEFLIYRGHRIYRGKIHIVSKRLRESWKIINVPKELEIMIPMMLAGKDLSETATITGQPPKPISNSVAALKDEVIIRA